MKELKVLEDSVFDTTSSNEIIENYALTKYLSKIRFSSLTPSECLLLYVISALTIGYNKDSTQFSENFGVYNTHMSTKQIFNILKSLQNKKCIIIFYMKTQNGRTRWIKILSFPDELKNPKKFNETGHSAIYDEVSGVNCR